MVEIRCTDNKNDFGFEMRRLLLRRIKDYYQPTTEKIVSNNGVNVNFINDICNDEELALEYGFIPIFADNQFSQVFYSYKTGESFSVIMADNAYKYLENSYSLTNSFSSSLALNIGFCYKLFLIEQCKIDDLDLVEYLTKETSKIEILLKNQKQLTKDSI